ncbi:DUF6011 domain-containing protein [Streptomyces sp. NPDC018055]|uniref:DUF6011 domain-containing protein n=1 Tax=Streptomyces sp. NPDC018055 TaxID=3365038 RepID=UPI0037938320
MTNSLKIIFETTACYRCSGTGYHGPRVVQGGKCFDCNGSGRRLTRRGRTASTRYDALIAERLGTPAEKVTKGTLVYSHAMRVGNQANVFSYPTRWRKVHAISDRLTQYLSDGEETERRTVNVYFDATGAEGRSAVHSAPVGGDILLPVYDRDTLEAITREVARRFKGAWLDGEEPPAPITPKPKSKTEETASVPENKPEPHTYPNKYAGNCVDCRGRIAEEQGETFKRDNKWVVRHTGGTCPEKEAPAPAPEPDPVTQEGMYRRADGEMFRVKTSDAGRLYAEHFHLPADGRRARLEYEKGAIFTLRAADRMTVDQAAEFGRKIGACIVCGRRLIKPKSIAAGIGPVCAENIGGTPEPSALARTVDPGTTTPAAPAEEKPTVPDNPTMADVRAVTPAQLTTMTPPQIDRMNATLSEEYERIDAERDRVWERLYSAVGEEKVKQGRALVWPLRRDEVEEKARAIVAEPPAELPARLKRYDFTLTAEKYVKSVAVVLAKLDALGEESLNLNRQVRPKLGKEWARRGGWSRFYLVKNVDGHIHKATSPNECHTLRWDTSMGWLPDLSGLTEKDAVKAHGPILCTVCFPSAPLEWTVGKPKDDGRCDGSGQYVTLDASMARRLSPWATCPVCGEKGVSVTSTWKLRKHKPKEAPEEPSVAEEAPVVPAVASKEEKSAPAADKPPKGPAQPTALSVSKFLAAAGFRRSSTTSTTITEGFAIRDHSHGDIREVAVRWVESFYEADRRRTAAGLADFADLPDNPRGADMAAAYADALSARYRVELSGSRVTVYPLDTPRRTVRGRPTVKALTQLLRDSAIPMRTGAGYSDVTGCALVQEADHVRIQVRPWEVVRSWRPEELDSAAGQVTAALDAAGYAYTRADDVNSAVLKVTGTASQQG